MRRRPLQENEVRLVGIAKGTWTNDKGKATRRKVSLRLAISAFEAKCDEMAYR